MSYISSKKTPTASYTLSYWASNDSIRLDFVYDFIFLFFRKEIDEHVSLPSLLNV